MRHITRAMLPAWLLANALFALDPNSLKPQGYVSDFARVLDAQSRAELENYCGRVEQATGVQMAMVTLDSLEGEPIEDFTNTLFRKWGVVKDRRDRIEVGYGLEPILPDGFAGGVLREARPLLRQNAYGAALFTAAEQMGSRIAAAKGVSLDFGLRPVRPIGPIGPARPGLPLPLIVIGIILLLLLMRGGGGGFWTGLLLGNLLGRGRGSGGWGGGGFGGYDSGAGGGFGGFGGGDSGGGGASSDW